MKSGFLAVALLLVASCAAQAQQSLEPTDGTHGRVKLHYSNPNGNTQGPNAAISGYVVWPDSMPSSELGGITGVFTASTTSGVTADAQGQPLYSDFYMPYAFERTTMGQGQMSFVVIYTNGGYTTSYPPPEPGEAPAAFGTTIVNVAKTDDGSRFVPVDGVIVTMACTSPAGYPKQATTQTRVTATGKQASWITFGRLAAAGSSQTGRPDAAYPSGYRDNHYTFGVPNPPTGYHMAAMAPDPEPSHDTGAYLIGKGVILLLVKNTIANPPTSHVNSTGDAGDGLKASVDGTDAGAGAGAGTGTGTAAPGPTDGASWYDNFWEKFKAAMAELFVPPQADIDALRSALAQFATYGFNGIPLQLVSFSNDIQSLTLGANGPEYWRWYCSAPAIALIAYPALYDNAKEVQPPTQVSVYQGLLPQYFDLTVWARELLIIRSLVFMFMWMAWLRFMVRKLLPKVKL
jgi:hypothetical protein